MLETLLKRTSIRNSAVALATAAAMAGTANNSYAQGNITRKPTAEIQPLEITVGDKTTTVKEGAIVDIPYETDIYVAPQWVYQKGTKNPLRTDTMPKKIDPKVLANPKATPSDYAKSATYMLNADGSRIRLDRLNPEDLGVNPQGLFLIEMSAETQKEVTDSSYIIGRQGAPKQATPTPVVVQSPAPVLPPQATIPTPDCKPTVNTVTNYVYNTVPCEPEKRDRKIFQIGAFYDDNGMISGNAGFEMHGRRFTFGIGGTFGSKSSTLDEEVQNDTTDTRGPAGIINSTTRVRDTHKTREVGLVADLLFGKTGGIKVGPEARVVYQGIHSNGYTVLQQVRDASGKIIASKEIECVGDIYSAVLLGGGVAAQVPVKKNSKGETTIGLLFSAGALYGGVGEAVVPTTTHIVNYRNADGGRKSVTPYVRASLVFGK